jgi:hypothetical protein
MSNQQCRATRWEMVGLTPTAADEFTNDNIGNMSAVCLSMFGSKPGDVI